MHAALVFALFFATATLLQQLLGRILRRKLTSKMTGVDNLQTIGQSRPINEKIKGTAIVCGGSIAGLYSARVCSDHFEDVCIIEPEAWLSTDEGTIDRIREESSDNNKPNLRTRVLQYTAFHACQTFTLQAWRRWFPKDADAELAAVDAHLAPADLSFHIAGARLGAPMHLPELPQMAFMSRAVLETTLRRLVRKCCPNVRFVVGTVSGLNASSSDSAVIDSISYRPANSCSSIKMQAALVIDCTGPAQAGVKMLERVGWGMTPNKPSLTDLRTSYNPFMRYTTAEFQAEASLLEKTLPADFAKLGSYIIFAPNPAVESRVFGMTRVEHNHLSLLVGGYDYAGKKPRSINDIRTHLQDLTTTKPIPSFVLELLDGLEKSGAEDKATYVDHGVPALTMIPYERASNMPSNFVALGDSTMRLNPAGGQGCTKAAVSATVLDNLLRHPSARSFLPPTFGPSYFKEVAPKINYLWNSTRLRDYAFETTKPSAGETLETGAFNRWYMSNFLPVALKDRDVAATFWAIGQFIAPPTDMFAPSIVFKVLAHAASRYLH